MWVHVWLVVGLLVGGGLLVAGKLAVAVVVGGVMHDAVSDVHMHIEYFERFLSTRSDIVSHLCCCVRFCHGRF